MFAAGGESGLIACQIQGQIGNLKQQLKISLEINANLLSSAKSPCRLALGEHLQRLLSRHSFCLRHAPTQAEVIIGRTVNYYNNHKKPWVTGYGPKQAENPLQEQKISRTGSDCVSFRWFQAGPGHLVLDIPGPGRFIHTLFQAVSKQLSNQYRSQCCKSRKKVFQAGSF